MIGSNVKVSLGMRFMMTSRYYSFLHTALHYKIPYPRPVSFNYRLCLTDLGTSLNFKNFQINVAPNFVSASKDKKSQLRRRKQSQPIYIHSQDK